MGSEEEGILAHKQGWERERQSIETIPAETQTLHLKRQFKSAVMF